MLDELKGESGFSSVTWKFASQAPYGAGGSMIPVTGTLQLFYGGTGFFSNNINGTTPITWQAVPSIGTPNNPVGFMVSAFAGSFACLPMSGRANKTSGKGLCGSAPQQPFTISGPVIS